MKKRRFPLRHRRHGALLFGGALAIVSAVLSCGDGPTEVRVGPPASLVIVAGDSQTATVGTELPAPVVVRVTDASGNPVLDQIVNFRVVAGGGSVFAGASITNSAGEARERWTLGTVATDSQRLEVRAVDATTGAALVFAVFRATAVPAAPASLSLTTSAAGAASGAAFTTQPVLTLRDALGNVATNDNSTVVTITVSDDGIVVGSAAATASSGVATFSTTGIRGTAGTNYTLTFSASGPPPVTQSINLMPGAVATVTVSPETASLFAGGRQLTAVVKDADGNDIAGPVSWASLDATVAAVSATGVVTPVNDGTTRITATFGGKADSAAITVQPFTFTEITASSEQTCGVASSGGLYCWGRGYGEMTPVQVSTTVNFVSLVAGSIHFCGLTSTGATYCWGNNGFGQLGDGTRFSSYREAPMPVAFVPAFASLAAGGAHSCGVTGAGAAYCWGRNKAGEIGDGTIESDRLVAVPVTGNHTFSALTAGGEHTCGMETSGTALCWGHADEGQLGNGALTYRASPVPVEGGRVFSAIGAGANHSCAVTPAGASYCWGHNSFGQVGDGSRTNRSTPTQVQATPGFEEIAGGGNHTCALTSAGEAYCWGINSFGHLGDGTTTLRLTPAKVLGGLTFKRLAVGGTHTCGLTTAGVAYCWGGDHAGQLGDSAEHVSRSTPVPVARQ